MRINPDIVETRVFMDIAQEFVDNCDLELGPYASAPHYTLLYAFSDSIIGESVDAVKKAFPNTVKSLMKYNNNYKMFDWHTLSLAVDSLRGHSPLYFDTP